MIRYARPRTLDHALALLSEGKWRIIAGGTDFYPAQASRPIREDILDVNGLEELRHLSETSDHIIIGARSTWTDVVQASLPPAFDALKQAAREVGSVQIQNAGTVAGNLCNASPAADGVPALMTLDAEVELRSIGGVRFLPLGAFVLDNRKTALAAGEMVTSIRVPRASAAGASSFIKLGARRYLVISIAMSAARIETDREGKVAAAAVAVGSCSAVAKRLGSLESRLLGLRPGPEIATAVGDASLDELSPIDDVRGSAAYRREAAREIVVRALMAAALPPRAEGQAA